MPFSSEKVDATSARALPWLVAAAFFMQMLDGTILNTALPGIGRDLGVSPLKMQSVIIVYLVTSAMLIPASGWMADRFGTRRVFFAAICLFTFGSLLCAMSTTLWFLVLSRIVQGIGAAIMVPVGRLAILKAFPRKELVRVLSFVTVPGLIGPLVGPLAGGFLVEYASWHWIFLINLPVGLVGAFLTLRYMPDIRGEDKTSFDFKGFVIFSSSIVCIIVAMEGFGELDMPRVHATILCIFGLFLMTLYWLRCSRSANSIFNIILFKTRSFAVGIFGNLFARLGSGAMPFLIPLFLQLALGYSPTTAGLTLMITAVAGILGKQLISPIMNRIGFRAFLTANTMILALLMGSFVFVDATTPYAFILGLLGLFGTVNSMQFTAMNSITLIDLDDQGAASGNSLLSVTMQMSSAVGVAMAAALLSGFAQHFSALPAQERMMLIFHDTFLWVGAITLATSLIFSQTPRDAGTEQNETQGNAA